MTKAAPTTTGMISIYAGQTCLGHAMARGRLGFEAFDLNDRSLRMFRTRAAAVDAVSSSASAGKP
jgi:hypothetical protein